MPDMGSGHAGHGGGADVDPFPYDTHGPQHTYDPYSGHQSMEMPDARNYAPAGGNGYPSYATEGGYGAAAAMGGAAAGAAGAGAYGASRGYQPGPGAHSNTDYSQYSTSDQGHGSPNPNSPPPVPMTAAQAKQREAAAERARNRQSPQYGSSYPAGGSGSPEDEMGARRQSQGAMSDGRGSTVYQHTDFGSAPDEGEEELDQPAEIPPK